MLMLFALSKWYDHVTQYVTIGKAFGKVEAEWDGEGVFNRF